MYNERENIVKTLDHASAVLPTLGFSRYEIVIVDDGSQDGSAEVVEAWAAQHEMGARLRLVRHEGNRGYGRALKTGFEAAANEVVFYTDSDLPIDMAELRSALPLLAGADLVIGYRRNRQESLRRKVYSRDLQPPHARACSTCT